MAAEIVKVGRRTQSETPPVSRYNQVVDLNTTPGAAGNFTVPAGVNHIYITYTAGTLHYNASGTTAAAPSAAVTNGTGSSIVLQGRSMTVQPAQVISFQNATACWVTIECRGAAL
jgi:hypothetical protein